MSLRSSVLGLLHYSPLSGYEIKKIFDLSIQHIWTAKLSQIYRELSMLEDEGLISSRTMRTGKRPEKKVYSLTPLGRQAFLDWLNEYPVAFGPPRRDEFLLRVFFAARMDEALLKRELEEFITAIERIQPLINEQRIPELQRLLAPASGSRGEATGAGREARFWRFTVRRFQLTAEATVRWARECLREMEE